MRTTHKRRTPNGHGCFHRCYVARQPKLVVLVVRELPFLATDLDESHIGALHHVLAQVLDAPIASNELDIDA